MSKDDRATTSSEIRTRRLVFTDSSGGDVVALTASAGGELVLTRGRAKATIRLGEDETSITVFDPIGNARVSVVARLDGGKVRFHASDDTTTALMTRDGELAIEDRVGQFHEFITGG